MRNWVKKFKRPNLRSLIMSVLTLAVAFPLYITSCITVRAEETYSYDIGYKFEDYIKSANTLTNGENYIAYYSSVPLKTYAFSYATSGSAGGSNRVGTSLTYYICPADFSETAPAIWYYDSDGIQHTVNLGITNGVPCYVTNGGTIYTEYIDGGYKGNYTSCDWNISYMELPEGMSSSDALLAIYNSTLDYVTTDSPDNIKTFDSDFYFIGFKADNYVNASWQGVSDRTYMQDITPEYYVSVGFGYASPDSKEATQKVWLEEDFEYYPMKLSYDITEYKNKYEDMYLRAVYVVPSYRSPGAGWWHGQPSTIYLNEDGSVDYISTEIKNDYSYKHNFNNDKVDLSIPIPELSNLYHNGFTINNIDSGDYYIDVIVESCLLGAKHNETVSSVIEGSESYDIIADTNWVYSSHYWNFTETSDIAINQSQVDINELWGVDNISALVNDFKQWSVDYPNHRALPDYNFFRHMNSGYYSSYVLRHLYDDSVDNESKLKSSGRAQTTFYVRFYDKNFNCGQWISYTYRDGEIIDSTLLKPSVTVSPIVGDTDGNPIKTDPQNGAQNSDGSIDLTVDYPNISEINTTHLWNILHNLTDSLGDLPVLINTIFSIFPSWLMAMIYAGIAAIIIFRFLGR